MGDNVLVGENVLPGGGVAGIAKGERTGRNEGTGVIVGEGVNLMLLLLLAAAAAMKTLLILQRQNISMAGRCCDLWHGIAGEVKQSLKIISFDHDNVA